MISKGIIWDLIGRFLNQGVAFVISIFLARLLSPEDFGLVGMVLAFISIAQIFVDLGFQTALIQKDKLNQIEYSSVFWLNIILASIVVVIFCLGADIIAAFYHREELVTIVYVLSFIFLFNASSVVNQSILIRNMDFRGIAFGNLTAALISGTIGIYMAFNGFGVWSLVVQHLINSIVIQIMLWYQSKWIPSLKLSIEAIKPLWAYSQKVFAKGLLTSFFFRLDILVIGRLFSPSILGYYTRAQSLEQIVKNYTSQSLKSVLLSAMSKLQNQPDQIIYLLNKYIRLAAIISLFLTGALFLISKSLIIILFSEKWIQSVDMFRILIIATFTYPICALINTGLEASGNIKRSLKLEVFRKLILLIIYPIGFYWGIYGFLYAWIVYRFIDLVLTMILTFGLFKWESYFVIKSIIFPFIITVTLVLLVHYLIPLDYFSNLNDMLSKGMIFVALFMLVFYRSYKKEFFDLKNAVKQFLKFTK